MTYFRRLYERTMREAYGHAEAEIARVIDRGGSVLDCGAGDGRMFDRLARASTLTPDRYHGIEWQDRLVRSASGRGLDVVQGDLNQPLPFATGRFDCVFALSLVEHLLYPCRFIREAQRVLAPGGSLVLLTPNISTPFTVALLLMGRMPSSGPDPDSESLGRELEAVKVSRVVTLPGDRETDMPEHRHLVVFSFRVLQRYLEMLGLEDIRGRGFGLYPFPNVVQPMLERLDPWHCHQMVFLAKKPG